MFALPHDVHPVMLAYRADLVEALGIDVNRLTTWDEFTAAGRRVVKDLDGDGVPDRYMLDLPLAATWGITLLLRQRGIGLFDEHGRVAFNDPKTVDTIIWYLHQTVGKDRIAFECGEGQPLMKVYGIFLFRQAMMAVPNEMLDAARVDGASELGIYFRLVMPLVRPMSATFCLVTFLASWNAFFAPSVFLQSQSKLTLPVFLNQYIGVYDNDYGVFLAGTLLAIVPPALLFFALEKEFISGLTSGAVKG